MSEVSDINSAIYFAYGANLNRGHMTLWCPNSTPLESATLCDFRLVFRFWCDILTAPGKTVLGALYRLGPGDLRWLDEYQDCPRLYEHHVVTVRTRDGRNVQAMTYQMKPGNTFAPPDTEYMAIVRQGYVDWSYDPALLPSG